MALMSASGSAWPVPDFLNSFPENSADLHGELARDVATLDVELERARALLAAEQLNCYEQWLRAVSSNGYEQWLRATAPVSSNSYELKNMLDVELERARALLAVSNNGYELKNMSEQWRADRGVVLAAVRQCGEALRFASSELVQDSVVVLAAVLENPWALRFAAQHFEGSKHVVIAAVRKEPAAMEFANAAAKRDPEVFFHALSTEVLEYPVRLAAPGICAAGIVYDPHGATSAYCDQYSSHSNFLRDFEHQLLTRYHMAVLDWVARLAANGDEEAAHRQQVAPAGGLRPRVVDVVGWVTSKLDRRKALMVLHRGDARILPLALAAKVLEYL